MANQELANKISVTNYIYELEYEITGIAALLGILAEYVEKGDSELEGDEIMSLSMHLFRIKEDMKRKIEELMESKEEA